MTEDMYKVTTRKKDGTEESKSYTAKDFEKLDVGGWLEKNYAGNYKVEKEKEDGGYENMNLVSVTGKNGSKQTKLYTDTEYKDKDMDNWLQTNYANSYSVNHMRWDMENTNAYTSDTPKIDTTAYANDPNYSVSEAMGYHANLDTDDVGEGEKVTSVWGGFKEGMKGLYAGALEFLGQSIIAEEQSSGLKEQGNQLRKGYKEALAELERIQASGEDINKVLQEKAFNKEKEKELGVRKTFAGFVGDLSKADEAQKYIDIDNARATIRRVLEKNNGDIEKTRQELAGVVTADDSGHLGKMLLKESDRVHATIKETEGAAAFIGSLGPQILQHVGTIIVAMRNPAAAATMGRIGIGMITASAAGSAMKEARDYGASDGEIWTAGVTAGAIEVVSEKIPLDRYLGKVTKKVSKYIPDAITDAITSPQGRAELENVLEAASKKLGRKITVENFKEIIKDTAVEGGSEFIAEFLGTFTPMIYANREDYPTLAQALENGAMGAIGGVVMGGAIGTFSKGVQIHQHTTRRKEQGMVTVAAVNIEGSPEYVEIVSGDKDGKTTVLRGNGEITEVETASIPNTYTYSFEEFQSGLLQEAESDAAESGTLTEEQKQASANRVEDTRNELIAEIAERLGNDPKEIDAYLSDLENDRINPNSDAEIEYVAAYKHNQEIMKADAQHMAQQAEAKRKEIQERVGKDFWKFDENGKAIVEVVETEDGRGYVLGEKEGHLMVADESGKVRFVKSTEVSIKRQGLNEFLYGEVVGERNAQRQQAYQQSREADLNAARQTYAAGAIVELGTPEASKTGTVLEQIPDGSGVLVQMEDGSVRQVAFDEIINQQQERAENPDTIIERELAEIRRIDAEARRKARENKGISENIAGQTITEEVAQRQDDLNLPMTEDGRVDQRALWKNDPVLWARWNDQRRNDGGVDSNKVLDSAIQALEQKLQNDRATYDQMGLDDSDARDTLYDTINNDTARLEQLRQARARNEQATPEQTGQVEQTETEQTETVNPVLSQEEIDFNNEVEALQSDVFTDEDRQMSVAKKIESLEAELEQLRQSRPEITGNTQQDMQNLQAWKNRIDATIASIDRWRGLSGSLFGVSVEQVDQTISEVEGARQASPQTDGGRTILNPAIKARQEAMQRLNEVYQKLWTIVRFSNKPNEVAQARASIRKIVENFVQHEGMGYDCRICFGAEEVLENMSKDGLSRRSQVQYRNAVNAGELVNGFYAHENGKVYIDINNLVSLGSVSDVLVHESQHGVTSQENADLIDRAVAEVGVVDLTNELERIAQSDFYASRSARTKVDEIISYAIQEVQNGAAIEDITNNPILQEIIKEAYARRENNSLRGLGRNVHESNNDQTGSESVVGTSENGVLGRTDTEYSQGRETSSSRESQETERAEGTEIDSESDDISMQVTPEQAEVFEREKLDSNVEKILADDNYTENTKAELESLEEVFTAPIEAHTDELSFSITQNEKLKEKSIKAAEKHKFVARPVLDVANETIDAMCEIMKPFLDATVGGKRILPKEVYGKGFSTIFKNGSYGKTIENTTNCMRTLVYNDFVDEVRKKLGRPLTASESFLASQMLYDIAVDPQCLYCYVSLDRKAYDEYLLKYLEQRDAVLEKYNASNIDRSQRLKPQAKKKESRGKGKYALGNTELENLYREFLGSREDSPNMRERFNKWLDINNDPDQTLITQADLMTSETRSNLSVNGDNSMAEQIKDATRYAQSSSWAKVSEDYRAYNGEILGMGETTVSKLNKEYGLRFYSFSEYTPAFILENMQQIRDAAIRGFYGLEYTKELDSVRIFGSTGMNFNMSCFGRRADDGSIVMDTRQGANWDEVKELRQQYSNAGAVFVATDDGMLEWALNQDWIDVVIPFHIVRTGADIADFYGWMNYTSQSADKNAEGKKKDIMPREHQNSKEKYFELIKERELKPRFADVKLSDGRSVLEHPNYMKLVNETRRSVNESEKLKPIFNLDAAKKSFAEFVEKGGYYGGWYAVDEQGVQDAIDRVASDIESGVSARDVEYGNQSFLVDPEKALKQRAKRHFSGQSGVHGNKPLSLQEAKAIESINSKQKQAGVNYAEKFNLTEEDRREGELGEDALSFAISRRTNETIDKWLAKRTDLTAKEIEIFKANIQEEIPARQLASAWWFANGNIRLPEDWLKISDAIKYAQKLKVDPVRYNSPNDIIIEYYDRYGKPETEKEEGQDLLSPEDPKYKGIFTNKQEFDNGVTIYDVQDSRRGQQAVRDLVNDHKGVGFTCWCLIYSNSKGELTPNSWDYWRNTYNKLKKRVAFKDGKIVGFSADKYRKKSGYMWWDMADHPHGDEIVIEDKIPNDKYERSGETYFDVVTGAKKQGDLKYTFRGRRRNGYYEEFEGDNLTLRELYDNADLVKQESFFKDGRPSAITEKVKYNGKYVTKKYINYDFNGEIRTERNLDNNLNGKEFTYEGKWGNSETIYKSGKKVEKKHYYENGQLSHFEKYDDNENAIHTESYYDNGQLEEIFDLSNSIHEKYSENGDPILIKKGENLTRYYPDGSIEEKVVQISPNITIRESFYSFGEHNKRSYQYVNNNVSGDKIAEYQILYDSDGKIRDVSSRDSEVNLHGCIFKSYAKGIYIHGSQVFSKNEQGGGFYDDGKNDVRLIYRRDGSLEIFTYKVSSKAGKPLLHVGWRFNTDGSLDEFRSATPESKRKSPNIQTPIDAINFANSVIDPAIKEQVREMFNNDDLIPEAKVDVDSFMTFSPVADHETDLNFMVSGKHGMLRVDDVAELESRVNAMNMAERMESSGVDARAIKLATGWEKGIDGMWRYEIPDPQIKPIESFINAKKSLTLGDILEGDSVFLQMYPEAKNIKIVKGKGKRDLGGYYDIKENTLQLPFAAVKEDLKNLEERHNETNLRFYRESVDALRNTVLHEMQHYIQEQEGFASGGSPDMIDPDTDMTQINEVLKKYDEVWGRLKGMSSAEPEFNKTMREFRLALQQLEHLKRLNRLGEAKYKKLAGEVEAINVEKRAGMTPEERQQTLLAETEDIARERQIIYRAINDKQKKVGVNYAEKYGLTEEDTKEAELDSVTGELSFAISRRTNETIDKWLAKRTDLTEEEKRIFKLNIKDEIPARQLASAWWFANGNIRLPEDWIKIGKAMTYADKLKVDPVKYANPNDIIAEYYDRYGRPEDKVEWLSPEDKQYEGIFTNKQVFDNGVVVYDVQDSKEGQQAVRDLMNDHLGVGYDCWCLAYSNSSGELTENAWHHWSQTYTVLTKRVAFKDGRIVSFSADNKENPDGYMWWDLADHPHGNEILIEEKIPDDKYDRNGEMFYNPLTNTLRQGDRRRTTRGRRRNGYYEVFEDDNLVLREFYKGREKVKAEGFFSNGALQTLTEWDIFPDDKYHLKSSRLYTASGELHEAIDVDENQISTVKSYSGDVLEKVSLVDKDDRTIQETSYYPNGEIRRQLVYDNGVFILHNSYYPNGNIKFKETHENGVDTTEEYFENGNMSKRETTDGSYKEKELYYESTGKIKRRTIEGYGKWEDEFGRKKITEEYDENGNFTELSGKNRYGNMHGPYMYDGVKGNFKNGDKVGFWVADSADTKYKSLFSDDGQLIISVVFRPNSNSVKYIEYQDERYHYDEDGRLIESNIYGEDTEIYDYDKNTKTIINAESVITEQLTEENTPDINHSYEMRVVANKLLTDKSEAEIREMMEAEENEDLLFSIRRGNSGYSVREDGTSASVRAIRAEEEGRYTQGKFRSEYKVGKDSFDLLNALGVIDSNEWHHTGKSFTKSDFYSWTDADDYNGDVDYADRASVPSESYMSIYQANKKEIDKLAREYAKAEWGDRIISVPTFERWANEIANKEGAFKLTPEQEQERDRQHKEISENKDNIDSYYRRLKHKAVDEVYDSVKWDNVAYYIEEHRAELEQKYADRLKEVEQINKENAEKVEKGNYKETYLNKIASYFGIPAEDLQYKTERRRNRESMIKAQAVYDEDIKRNNVEAEKRNQDLQNWVNSLIKQKKAERVNRVTNKPEYLINVTEEMKGRYGWFEASSRYRLPIYYSGVTLKSKDLYDTYNQKRQDNLDAERAANREASKKFDAAMQDEGIKFSVAPAQVDIQRVLDSDDPNFNDIRFAIGRKRKEEMRQGLRSKLTTMTDAQIDESIVEIELLGEQSKEGGNPKVEKVAFKWFANGKIILPQDQTAVMDAIKVAEKHKVDPMNYDSPYEIFDEFGMYEGERKLLDPNTINEFSRPVEFPEGIVVYDVDDSVAGMESVRRIVDSHFGKDTNCWCLITRKDGKLDYAWEMWNYYSDAPKRIAFKDGKLLAFYAQDELDEPSWWDRTNSNHWGIPIKKRVTFNGEKAIGKGEIDENFNIRYNEYVVGSSKDDVKKTYKESVLGSDKAYFLSEVENRKDGKLVSRYHYNTKGQVQSSTEVEGDLMTIKDYLWGRLTEKKIIDTSSGIAKSMRYMKDDIPCTFRILDKAGNYLYQEAYWDDGSIKSFREYDASTLAMTKEVRYTQDGRVSLYMIADANHNMQELYNLDSDGDARTMIYDNGKLSREVYERDGIIQEQDFYKDEQISRRIYFKEGHPDYVEKITWDGSESTTETYPFTDDMEWARDYLSTRTELEQREPEGLSFSVSGKRRANNKLAGLLASQGKKYRRFLGGVYVDGSKVSVTPMSVNRLLAEELTSKMSSHNRVDFYREIADAAPDGYLDQNQIGDPIYIVEKIMDIYGGKPNMTAEDKQFAKAVWTVVLNNASRHGVPIGDVTMHEALDIAAHIPPYTINDVFYLAQLARGAETEEDWKAAEKRTRMNDMEAHSIQSAVDMYNRSVSNWRERLKESFVDMYQSVGVMMEAIEKATGKPAQAFEDIRKALNAQSSKGEAMQKKIINDYIKPMWSAVHAICEKTGMSAQEVERYMMIKHGLERNIVLAKRKAKEAITKKYNEDVAKANQLQGVDRLSKLADLESQYKSDMQDVDLEASKVYIEMRKKDYGRLTGIYSEKPQVDRRNFKSQEEYNKFILDNTKPIYATVAEMEDAARKEIEAIEKSNKKLFKQLWSSVNGLTNHMLDVQLEANMITKKSYDAMKSTYEYYVPLRDHADPTATQLYDYFHDGETSPYQFANMRAEGGTSEAASPLNHLGNMASSIVVDYVKNKSKLALYYFLSNRQDNGLARINKTFYEAIKDHNGTIVAWSPVYPPADNTYDIWMADMQKKIKDGDAKQELTQLDLQNTVVRVADNQQRQHAIRVKVGGEEYTIILNGNPRAAEAINGLLNIETASVYKTMLSPVLRYMSSINTSYNPSFWITNFMRDFTHSFSSAFINGNLKGYAKRYGDAFKVVKYLQQERKGKDIGNSELAQHYKRFAENGGITGYSKVISTEEWETMLNDYLKEQKRGTSNNKLIRAYEKSVDAIRGALQAIQTFGESIEQVSRFAAYLAAIDEGKSVQDAVASAKEITVNFNRKGSGQMITWAESGKLKGKNGQALKGHERIALCTASALSPAGRSLYMFFNATVQAMNNVVKLARTNPKRMAGVATGYFMLGLVNSLLHALFDDDDDYLDMPDYDRRNNLLIGAKGYYLKWALPQEMRAFYGLADVIVNEAMGRQPHKSGAGQALDMVLELFPINLAEGWRGAVPSIFVPFVELLANENYKGTKIYNDMPYYSEEQMKGVPKYSKAYKSTGRVYVDIAEMLNNVTGGDYASAGSVNIAPEAIEHLANSYGGGTYRTVVQTLDTMIKMFSDPESLTLRGTPFINRVVVSNDERLRNTHTTELYNYYKGIADNAKRKVKEYTAAGDAEKLTALYGSDEYKIAVVVDAYKDALKKYDEILKLVSDKERPEYLRAQDELRDRMIDTISGMIE